MSKIKSITCHKVLDSRGNWTIETHVELEDGSQGAQTVPDGASKGENEAIYVSADKAIEIVQHPIADLLRGKDATDQKEIDRLMLEMDGTINKSHLGGNSMLSVSLANAKAAAQFKKVELFEHLASLGGYSVINPKLPTPVFNVLNGGKHAHNGLSFQEFMVIPNSAMEFDKAMELGVAVYHSLKEKLSQDGYDTDVGDEGGFAPNNFTVEKALDYLVKAIEGNYKLGEDVFFGMDVAAESFYDHKNYIIKEQELILNSVELGGFYAKLLKKYPLIYLEDPFYEGDYSAWKEFCEKYGAQLMVVGDDLVVTNPRYLKKAINEKLANAVIVKPNQVGTLTETLEFVKNAQDADMAICISHRSGDTGEDTFIADLAVAVGAEFMKSGAPARGERTVKYNRLLEIYGN